MVLDRHSVIHSLEPFPVSLEVDGKVVLCFALAYGFPSIQNLIRKMKHKSIPCPYHFVEVKSPISATGSV